MVQNSNNELALFTKILLDNKNIHRVAAALQDSDFFTANDRLVFKTLKKLIIKEGRQNISMGDVKPAIEGNGCKHTIFDWNKYQDADVTSDNIEVNIKALKDKRLSLKIQDLAENPPEDLPSKLIETIESYQSSFDKKYKVPALTWEVASAGRFLTRDPPQREYTFNNLLPKECVGQIVAEGGTGKSLLLLELAICLATGENLSIFHPTRKYKVLYLGAEDPEDELHRRVDVAVEELGIVYAKDIHDNLAIFSTMGVLGPLLMLDRNGNVTTTENYEWLRETLTNLGNIEILMIDPKSRFYGLIENSNDNGTAWVQCLEGLLYDFDLRNILFSHHVSKGETKEEDLSKVTGRGGFSVRDGVRWSASMREMMEKTAKKFHISKVNQRKYVELDISKANWSPKLPRSVFFKRGRDGILLAADLGKLNEDKYREVAVFLRGKLNKVYAEGEKVSRNDIIRKESEVGEDIHEDLKSQFNLTMKEITEIINFALVKKLVCEEDDILTGRGTAKKLLKPSK